jgi:hypothetical protein
MKLLQATGITPALTQAPGNAVRPQRGLSAPKNNRTRP